MRNIAAGTPIVYYTSGSEHAETIVFLHAAFADHTSFDKQVDSFSQRYRVITPDLLGHGESLPKDGKAGMSSMSDYLEKILNHENISRIHLVGVSLGGVVAQDFANKYPERLASLCCVGAYDINNFDPKAQKENSKAQMMMMLTAFFSIRKFAEANSQVSAVTPEAQAAYYAMNTRFRKSSFRYLASISDMVNKQQTAERRYPLMISCGSEDIPSLLPIVREWHEREAGSTFVTFEEAGHLANMDSPIAFNKAYQDFLDRKWSA